MILRDQKIDSAVVVVISGDDRAWIFELNFVQAGLRGHVFPSVGAEIPEEADFAFPSFVSPDARGLPSRHCRSQMAVTP